MDDIFIVGMSMTKMGAFLLIRDIIRDVYSTTGMFDCKDYFLYDMTVR